MGKIDELDRQIQKDKSSLNNFNKVIADCDMMLKILDRELPYLEKHPWAVLQVCDMDTNDAYPLQRQVSLVDLTPEEIQVFKQIIERQKASMEERKREIEAKYD